MRTPRDRLRLWHLFGLIAAFAMALSYWNYLRRIDDPAYAPWKRLRSPAVSTRLDALDELHRIGLGGRPAFGSILDALNDPDPRVRERAAQVLANFNGSEARDVATALAITLRDPVAAVRHAATLTLASLAHGPDPDWLVAPLIEAASNPDLLIRREALRYLGRFAYAGNEPAFLAVLGGLKDREHSARELTFGILTSESLPTPLLSRVVDAMVSALDSPDASIRAAALASLGSLSVRTPIDVIPIIRSISDPDPSVRAAAISSFGSLSIRTPIDEGPIVGSMSDPDPQVRLQVVMTLETLLYTSRDDDDRNLSLILSRATRDKDASVRMEAERWVQSNADFKTVTLPRLLADLDAASAPVRTGAAKELGQYGWRARPSVPALNRRLDDRDWEVRRESARALARIGPAAKSALAALDRVAVDKDEDAMVARAAKEAAASIRDAMKP